MARAWRPAQGTCKALQGSKHHQSTLAICVTMFCSAPGCSGAAPGRPCRSSTAAWCLRSSLPMSSSDSCYFCPWLSRHSWLSRTPKLIASTLPTFRPPRCAVSCPLRRLGGRAGLLGSRLLAGQACPGASGHAAPLDWLAPTHGCAALSGEVGIGIVCRQLLPAQPAALCPAHGTPAQHAVTLSCMPRLNTCRVVCCLTVSLTCEHSGKPGPGCSAGD